MESAYTSTKPSTTAHRNGDESVPVHWVSHQIKPTGSSTAAICSHAGLTCSILEPVEWGGVAVSAMVSQLTQWTYCAWVTEQLSTVIRSSYCQPQLYLSWGQKVKDTTCYLKIFQLLIFITKMFQGKILKLSAVSIQHSAKTRQPLSYKESQSFAKICLID